MRLLELFSGTGSVGRAFSAEGWEAISLDSDSKAAATISVDILDWDCTIFPPGHFDAIWASPPCTEYSRARTVAKTPRNLELADALVQCTLDVIAYYKPKAWWIENPWTGLLRTRPVVAGMAYVKIDYCRFGAPYKKRTALWTNVPFAETLCDKRCPGWTGHCHAVVAQRGGCPKVGAPPQTLDTLHALPPRLTSAIEAATRAFIQSET